MDPRLAKSIEEYGCLQNYDEHEPTRRISAESKLLHVSDKFSRLVEDLSITFKDEALTPTLYEILQKCCPNLKRLELFHHKRTFADPELSHVSLHPLPTRPNLTFLKIFGITEPSGSPERAQLILNSASNVTHFTYHGKKYPDLSRNKAIKWLTVHIDCAEMTRIPTCQGAHGLNKMLNQVKDQIQFLHLKMCMISEAGNSYDDFGVWRARDEAVRIGFQIPKMKNLKEFRNEVLDLFRCGDQLQDIYPERMPNLEILHIAECTNNLDKLLQNIMQKKDLFNRVKKLHLLDINDPESITGLRTPFPNLESLTILQLDKWIVVELVELGPHLQACVSLGLKCLELELSSRNEKLSEFIQGFSNCEELLSSKS